jgi:hypothetical protein
MVKKPNPGRKWILRGRKRYKKALFQTGTALFYKLKLG